LSTTPEQSTAWQEFIDAIRDDSPDVSIVPDTEPWKPQLQVTHPASNRQVTLDFVKPPDMIIHLDDQGVSASGGTSAFGIEMAKFVGGKFELLRRKKTLAPKELGVGVVHWLQHGTL
jgi:hypothetical protein